jgi:pimeloyl-ACP methyl ester carboxylesterase
VSIAWATLRSLAGDADQALSVLNGMLGDLLEERQSSLAIPMAFRCDGADVSLDRHALADQLSGATGAVCLFVPGLMSSDAVWRFPRHVGMTYGSRLAADRNVTSVFLRYNSGRHVSVNGRQLALLLDGLVAAWPVEVDELSLVGHSMGGLVVRSACYYGALNGCSWVEKVRRVFLLGAPMSGVDRGTSFAAGQRPRPGGPWLALARVAPTFQGIASPGRWACYGVGTSPDHRFWPAGEDPAAAGLLRPVGLAYSWWSYPVGPPSRSVLPRR